MRRCRAISFGDGRLAYPDRLRVQRGHNAERGRAIVACTPHDVGNSAEGGDGSFACLAQFHIALSDARKSTFGPVVLFAPYSGNDAARRLTTSKCTRSASSMNRLRGAYTC